MLRAIMKLLIIIQGEYRQKILDRLAISKIAGRHA